MSKTKKTGNSYINTAKQSFLKVATGVPINLYQIKSVIIPVLWTNTSCKNERFPRS